MRKKTPFCVWPDLKRSTKEERGIYMACQSEEFCSWPKPYVTAMLTNRFLVPTLGAAMGAVQNTGEKDE